MRYFYKLTIFIFIFSFSSIFCQALDRKALRSEAKDLLEREHFAEALEKFQLLLKLEEASDSELWDDFHSAQRCLTRLSRIPEIDELLAELKAHKPTSWWLHWRMGRYIIDMPSWGIMHEGKFYRASHTIRGKHLNVSGRNRHESLWHYEKARVLLEKQAAEEKDKLNFYLDYAAAFLLQKREIFLDRSFIYNLSNFSWHLQKLLNLQEISDWEASEKYYISTKGATVNEQGDAVFYEKPASFAAAKNDGERFRWLLQQAAEISEHGAERAKLMLANFSYSLFGVHTLQTRNWFAAYDDASNLELQKKLQLLEGLQDNETLAQLANGMKRFNLPEDYSYIKLFKEISQANETSLQKIAFYNLARIYENRQQFEKALQYWQEYEKLHPKGAENPIRQITGNLGQFLSTKPQPFGTALKVDFQFRNADKVKLQLYKIDLPSLMAEHKKNIIKDEFNYHSYPFSYLGSWLLGEEQAKFRSTKVREWEEALEALPGHRDRITTLEIDITEPGAYWLVAELPGGHKSRIPIMAEKYQLLMKPMKNEVLWQLVNSINGEAVANADLQFFVWTATWDSKSRKNILLKKDLQKTTDEFGCVYVDAKDLPGENSAYHLRWLASANINGQENTFVCSSVIGNYFFADGQTAPRTKAFLVSDRPIYRPGHSIKYKAWLKVPLYDGNTNPYAGKKAKLWLRKPNGETQDLLEADSELRFDSDGSISGEYQIPADAQLGTYRLGVSEAGKGYYSWGNELSFRVEEYRKPEFELSFEKPAKTPKLGSSFEVKLKAKYYFGTPVSAGKTNIKVLRYEHRTDFWPWRPWDWLYGKGYWYLGINYNWYPGWHKWALPGPRLPWLPAYSRKAPELVFEFEQELDNNGEVIINIDTALTKEIFGDIDQRYEITAEVSDLSRRSIASKTEVLVGEKAYYLRCWAEGGYFRVGESIKAFAQLNALDGSAAASKGTATLYRLKYTKGEEIEEEKLQEWEASTDEKGVGFIMLNANKSGQYRLEWQLSVDEEPEEQIIGTCIFNVYGKSIENADFRYNALELLPDKSEYKPGENLRLRINSEQADSLVMLFVRPENGICPRPDFLRLQGKSREIEIPLTKADIPNIFLEASLVSKGKLHQVIRSIAIPPESKVLDLQVEAEKTELQPGEDANINIKITELDGNAYQGNLTVAVYDKSLEALSGGTNVPAILPHFWSWKRIHYYTGKQMQWYLNNSLKNDEIRLQGIGIFSHFLAQETRDGFSKSIMMPLGANKPMKARSLESSVDAVGFAAAPMAESSELTADNVQLQEARVRTNFADTAFWLANLQTDTDGNAKFSFPMPDSLSSWKVRVWALSKECQVAEAERELITAKKLMVRLHSPRFFVEKDEVLLSAVINQELAEAVEVHSLLELEGDCLELLPEENAMQKFQLDAGDEVRVNWRVKVVKSGNALIRVKALSRLASDAMEQSFPVKVHGMQQMQAFSAVIKAQESSHKFVFNLPAEVRAATSKLTLAWSPSLALSILDALPYLLEPSYGTTEQTLNRFLPAVLSKLTLEKLGYSLKDLQDKKVNLNPQELGDAAERAEKNYRRNKEQLPIFSDEEMNELIRVGIADLAAMRCSDGGWGWFSGWGERSLPHMTAQIVHGLLLARKAAVEVPDELLQPGINWLLRYQEEEVRRLKLKAGDTDYKPFARHMDALVFKVLCESSVKNYNAEMSDFLFRDKKMLSNYAKALFAYGEWEYLKATGATDYAADSKFAELLRNLRQFVVKDSENQTAWLEINPSWSWYWYGDVNETQAIFLQLLVESGADHDNLAAELVKYLLNNRSHGNYWRSSRDTAAIIEAFCAYLLKSGELESNSEFAIYLDGKKLKDGIIEAKNFFQQDNRLVLDEAVLSPGKHEIDFRKEGKGPLYLNAYLEYFSEEDFLKKQGLELKIERNVYRLHKDHKLSEQPDKKGQVTELLTENYKAEKLLSGASINSGDLLEVELLIESKNDYEYLLIEDFKAANCETIETQSGYKWGAVGTYVEYRDDRTAFLINKLPRGKFSLKYRLKTENPGKFSALPAKISGFYAPELQGNSNEWKVEVKD